MTTTNENMKIELIAPEFLLLDPRNPRLVSTIEREGKYRELPSCDSLLRKQSAIMKKLDKGAKIDVLINSILSVGFIQIEPLIVVKTECKNENDIFFYLVIEGNRRLFAVKEILSDPEKLGGLNEEFLKTLQKLPCIVLESGQYSYMMNILGIRHIVAIEDWKLLQKAIMVAELYIELEKDESQVAESYGISIRETKRLLRAIALQNWMLENLDVEISTFQKLSFDIFLETMQKPSLREWLEYEENQSDLLLPSIKNLENVELLANWISDGIVKFGRDDIRALAEIVARTDRSELIEQINEHTGPYTVMAQIKTQEAIIKPSVWTAYLRKATNTVNTIPASELQVITDENLGVLKKLKIAVENALNMIDKLRGN